MPQLALQQVSPGPHVTAPQRSPPIGSHVAVSPVATHWVPAAQRTVAHGSVTMGSQLAVSPFATHCVSGGQSTAAQGFTSRTHVQTLGELSQ